jgi:hypothetical protein
MYWERNPLIITDAMRRYRIDDKVNAVVMMPAVDFLKLTLSREPFGYTKSGIIKKLWGERTPISLDQYNKWALDPGMLDDYPRAPMAPITLVIRPTENPAVWRVNGHEGRHRVAAMWMAGENLVEVSITMDYHRGGSILDLPPIIKGERFITGQISHHQFPTRKITEVLETNVQVIYQGTYFYPKKIENRWMSQEELVEKVIAPKTIPPIHKEALLRSLQLNYNKINWSTDYYYIEGKWDPVSLLERCVLREREDPYTYAEVTLDLRDDEVIKGSDNIYWINGQRVDTLDYYMRFCPVDNPKIVECDAETAIKLFGRDPEHLNSLESNNWSEVILEIDLEDRVKLFKEDLKFFLYQVGYYPKFGEITRDFRLPIQIKSQLG